MLNNIQAVELIKRVKQAIYLRYPRITPDQFEILSSAVVFQGLQWKNKKNLADPIPEVNLLSYIAKKQWKRCFYGGQQEIEEENRTDNRSPEEFNLVGETSEYDSPYYQDCSYEFLQEEAGFEAVQEDYETILLNDEEAQINKRINNQIIAFTSNYHIPKHLRDAIKHIKAGGELHAYAIAIGMSDQTLANQLKTALKTVNHAQQSLFQIDKDEVATIVKLQVTEPVNAVRRTYNKNQRRISDEEQRPLDF